MTLLPFTKCSIRKQRCCFRFRGSSCLSYQAVSSTSWSISKGQMLPLDCAWNLLAQGELSSAVLQPHCNRAERKCSSLAEWAPPWNSDRETRRYLSLCSGLAEDRELPFSCWHLGQHPCERGSFYLSLWLHWNSNPQPAPACLVEQVREHGLGHPPPPLLEAEVSPHPLAGLASRQRPAQAMLGQQGRKVGWGHGKQLGALFRYKGKQAPIMRQTRCVEGLRLPSRHMRSCKCQLPQHWVSAESSVPTAPIQAAVSQQWQDRKSRGGSAGPTRRGQKGSLCSECRVQTAHHGLELVPFFTSSRHLTGNTQGKSPTSSSPVLEIFFVPFIAAIPSSFWLSTVATPLEQQCSCPAWSFPRSFLATFKTDNALPTFCSFIPLF